MGSSGAVGTKRGRPRFVFQIDSDSEGGVIRVLDTHSGAVFREIPVEEGGGEFIIYVVCDDPACGSATAVQVNDPELFVDAWDPVDEPGPLVHVLNGEVG